MFCLLKGVTFISQWRVADSLFGKNCIVENKAYISLWETTNALVAPPKMVVEIRNELYFRKTMRVEITWFQCVMSRNFLLCNIKNLIVCKSQRWKYNIFIGCYLDALIWHDQAQQMCSICINTEAWYSYWMPKSWTAKLQIRSSNTYSSNKEQHF